MSPKTFENEIDYAHISPYDRDLQGIYKLNLEVCVVKKCSSDCHRTQIPTRNLCVVNLQIDAVVRSHEISFVTRFQMSPKTFEIEIDYAHSSPYDRDLQGIYKLRNRD